MFGRHFESMYTGSMIGSGSVVFAVWGYVISHMRPPAFEVELNPKLLAFILGDGEDAIEGAIEVLCSPDARSRSQSEEGRRLIRRGTYLYHVVNGETYNALRNDAEKKAYWRDQKKRQRLARKIEGNIPAQEPGSSPPPKFIKPTREELNLAAAKIGLPDVEVDKFVNHFESNGWKVGGKAPMKSWTSALSNWKIRWEENGHSKSAPSKKFIPPNPHNEVINVPSI